MSKHLPENPAAAGSKGSGGVKIKFKVEWEYILITSG